MNRRALFTLLFLVLACLGIAISLGAVNFPPLDWIKLADATKDPVAAIIIHWRIPRVLTAFLVGTLLGLSGVIFQGVFRNPLAEPYLLGSASGASVGAACSLFLPAVIPSLYTLPLFAFCGAWGATWIVLSLGRTLRVENGPGLLLAGVAVAAILGAIRSLLLLLADENANLKVMVSWQLGGIQTPPYIEVFGLFLAVLFVAYHAMNLSRGLDLLGLGEETAGTMGLDIRRFVTRSLLLASFATALAVAYGGLIGFVGLIVPHVLRWRFGATHARLLPASALCAGALLALMDGLARSALRPAEIPIGLMTALIGGPFFLWLMVKKAST